MTADEAEIQGAQSEIGEALQRVLDEKAIDASVHAGGGVREGEDL